METAADDGSQLQMLGQFESLNCLSQGGFGSNY